MAGYDADDAPRDDEPFDAAELGPVADGDWPAPLLPLTYERLPLGVTDRFGSRWAITRLFEVRGDGGFVVVT